MSKKLFFIVAGLIIVILGGFTGYLVLARNSGKELPSSLIPSNEIPQSLIDETSLYKDGAGFSFEYPVGLKIEDVTPDEEVYYSKVEASSAKHNDKIVISVKDTDNATVDEWLTDDPQMRLAQITGATSLGGYSAKQLSLNNGGKKLLMTVVIDGNILYLIEGPEDDAFWEEVQNLISSTFVVGERPEPVSSGTSSKGVIYEEEEIVE